MSRDAKPVVALITDSRLGMKRSDDPTKWESGKLDSVLNQLNRLDTKVLAVDISEDNFT